MPYFTRAFSQRLSGTLKS